MTFFENLFPITIHSIGRYSKFWKGGNLGLGFFRRGFDQNFINFRYNKFFINIRNIEYFKNIYFAQ